ncbi:MAG: PTS 2-O-a-mannosyl-D-glycerate transporter subunit IIABC, partial [Turicibacter sp.]
MQLKELTNKNFIAINLEANCKDDVIKALIKELYMAGNIESEEAFYQAIMDREALSPTGMEQGLAIPHGKSKTVKKASFAVATLKKPLTDWESIDPTNQVDFVFLLAIPENEAGSTHLKLLSELMTRLSNPDYLKALKTATSADELFNRLDEEKNEEAVEETVEYKKSIVAITACPAGIAHTYMAAEALVKAGKEMGVEVLVEKQGANGIEDRHTASQLQNADAAIFAVGVAVKGQERYTHLPQIKTPVAAPLRDAKGIIQQALDKAEKQPKGSYVPSENAYVTEEKVSFKTEAKDAILTGVSHIVPLIVAGGMLLAFAVLFSQAFGMQDVYNTEGSWLWMYRKLSGNLLGTIMVPVLSAYMAFSIGDKPALAPGFAAGVAANMIGGGFLGGMLGGFIAGYTAKLLKKYVPAKGTFAGFVSFWIYPVVGTFIVGTLMLFVLGTPVVALNDFLIGWLDSLTGTNAALLGAVIGIMVSFDLGGPINKAAYTFCIAAMTSGNLIPYAVFASVKMVSAFAITIATMLAKSIFTENEREIGKSTWILGLAGITEGA